MWSTFINWAQRQIWQEIDEPTELPPLPFLPPPSSNSETATTPDVPAPHPAPHNGIIFERLSPELRRMILIEAFGERTVHIDLRFDRPLRARPHRKTGHAGGVNVLDQGPASRQMKKPRAWQWYSCVCHRDAVWFVERWQGAGEGKMASMPTLDMCLQGQPSFCDGPPGDRGDMSRCFLGVMGWLMTSRQACMEGLDILYSTNKFNISGLPLMLHLPRLLPAKAVSDIQSVEMCWDLKQVEKPPITDQDISADPRFRGWRTFMSLLVQLPKSLPHLRYLHLTLQGRWFLPQMAANDLVRYSEPAILQPLDRMMRELYRTSGWSSPRYIVAIPEIMFRTRAILDSPALDDEQEDEEPKDVFGVMPKRRLLWRSLEPGSPGQSGLNNEPGYWLDNAYDDIDGSQDYELRADPILIPNIALAGDW